jgi:uncharacterized damage-inducible protein DinB
MTVSVLTKLFEHNNWANMQIIQACYALNDEQLDAEPQSVTKGTIRRTLLHLVHSQQGYLLLMTMPADQRQNPAPTFTELGESVRKSGEELLAMARGDRKPFGPRLTTKDGFYTDPWVVMLQVINHATEHREQIKSMLSVLGVAPPNIDGWDYGEATNALVPMAK